MMAAFRIGTFNCKNFKGTLRSTFISNMFNECDVLFLQEHWLYESQFHLFDSICVDTALCYHGKSAMNPDVQSRGRPFGGNVILWRSNLSFKIVPIETTSTRLSCVQIWISDDAFIMCFNAYMPCDEGRYGDNFCEFQDILSEISTLCIKYNASYVCFGGDLNTDFSRNGSPQTKELNNFIASENLISCSKLKGSIDYTFECCVTSRRSLIDHILVSENMKDILDDCYMFDDVSNGSDHIGIVSLFKLSCEFLASSTMKKTPRVAWYKAQLSDIEHYKSQLDFELSLVSMPSEALECTNVKCKTHINHIETFYSEIINACTKASKVLPQTGGDTGQDRPAPVPGWTELCKEKRKAAIFWHNVWKSAGRPRNGQLALIRRHTRAKYHRAVKLVKRNKDKFRSEKMAQCIRSNQTRDFWKEAKAFRGKTCKVPVTVDGATGDNAIANVFVSKFKHVFNSVGYTTETLAFTEKNILDNVFKMSDDSIKNSLIECSEVCNVIKSLKKGKSDGGAVLFSDHFIHGTHTLYNYIALLFNAMIIHCTSPHDMLVGTMVPIPKGNRLNVSISDNFRGICLQSLLCKLLDMIILKREKIFLSTSNAQFGFKEGLSANMGTSMVTETIDYYQNRGGSVFALALDATKAFDRVDFNKLFLVLEKRGINPLYTRLLFYMYVNQHIRIRYNGTCSEFFNVSNGVKQGGVISPTLFTCYIDGMLEELKESRVGCFMGHEYLGCVSYADDLVLLAPNITALKNMIHICENYADEYKIKFNGSKSKLLVFDKYAPQSTIAVSVSGEPVEHVTSLKYLGHSLLDNRQDPHIHYVRRDFIRKVNSFLADFSSISSNTKFDLFNTYCMSLYGTHECDLDTKSMDPLYVEWRKSVRIIWNIPSRAHSSLLCHISRITGFCVNCCCK